MNISRALIDIKSLNFVDMKTKVVLHNAKSLSFVHFLQEGMQFYDTPRTLMQDQPEIQGNFANYDTPQQPLPVYKKPCGCIMKLVKTGESLF